MYEGPSNDTNGRTTKKEEMCLVLVLTSLLEVWDIEFQSQNTLKFQDLTSRHQLAHRTRRSTAGDFCRRRLDILFGTPSMKGLRRNVDVCFLGLGEPSRPLVTYGSRKPILSYDCY